jgi:hypothetical protein
MLWKSTCSVLSPPSMAEMRREYERRLVFDSARK